MSAIPPQLIGESPEFHALMDWVSDVASLEKPILVIGEPGTGKELVASRLHFLSKRWEQSYHSLNCAAYDAESLLWQLFGDDTEAGILARADGGTLYLDNILATGPDIRERLLRYIDYGVIVPERQSQSVDVRIVASSAVVPEEKSDRDFLSRLAFDSVVIPPLRERPDDVPALMLHFGRKIVSSLEAERFPGVTPEALERLLRYAWPGNIRELKHVVERSTARAFLADETLTAPISTLIFDTLPESRQGSEAGVEAQQVEVALTAIEQQQTLQTTDFTQRVMTFERGLIDEAMTVNDHHQGKAADYLGLSYHQFRGLLRKHGMKK